MKLRQNRPFKIPIKRWWFAWLIAITVLTLIIPLIGCGDQGGDESKYQTENERIVKTFTPESRNAFQDNSPTIINDFLYIGTSTFVSSQGNPEEVLAALPANYFYKMDLDLNVIWQYPLGASMVGGGASLDSAGNIYFVTVDFSYDATAGGQEQKENFRTLLYLYSLSGNGEYRWKKQISTDDEVWAHGMITCAVGADDTIYVGDSKLFAFDPAGNIKWQYPDDNRIIIGYRNSPIIDAQGDIYFISPEPVEGKWETNVIRAYKFSPVTQGTPVWSTVMDNNILDPEGGNLFSGGAPISHAYSTPAFTSGCKTLIAAVGNTINCVDTTTGEILWSLKPEGATGAFKNSPVVDADDNIYIGTKSNMESMLYGIRADGSGLLWKRLIGADMYTSPLLGDDGKLYIGSEGVENGSHFHAIDMNTGETIWDTGFGKNPMPDINLCSPALYKGYIYLGSHWVLDPEVHREALFKIKADAYDYLPGSPWPRYHGGNSNNGRFNGE